METLPCLFSAFFFLPFSFFFLLSHCSARRQRPSVVVTDTVIRALVVFLKFAAAKPKVSKKMQEKERKEKEAERMAREAEAVRCQRLVDGWFAHYPFQKFSTPRRTFAARTRRCSREEADERGALGCQSCPTAVSAKLPCPFFQTSLDSRV